MRLWFRVDGLFHIRDRDPIGTALFFACALMFGLAGVCAADDEEILQQYLQRLELHDLRMQQLERMLQLPRSKEQQETTVEQLADLYVSQLLSAADDDALRQKLVDRVNRLLQKHPQAKTPALDVMLLQADYAAAESAAEKWLEDPSDAGMFKTANEILARIAPELEQYQANLETKIEELNQQLDAATAERTISELEEQLEQTQQVAGRAAFYSAWSQYYLGALQQTQAAGQPSFAKSRDIFRKFLGIEDSYDGLRGDELGLGSPALSRAMIGLAFAEIGSGNEAAGRQVLSLLEHSDAPLELRSQTEFWHLQGLINAKRWAAAAGHAQSVLASESTTNPAVQLSVSVRAAVAGLARSELNDSARELGLTGVSGLAKLRRFQIARQLLDKYGIVLDEATGFYLLWISGQQLLAIAEHTGEASKFQEAANRFQQALDQPESKLDLASASQCQYELAYCQFKLGQHYEAAETYAGLISALSAIDESMAANAAWMAFAGYQKSLQQHPEGRRKAIKVLERLKRDFPDSQHAAKVDYQISLLQRENQSTEEAMAELEAIKPENENYTDSRYDLCLLIHKQWNAVEGDEQGRLVPQVTQFVDLFLAAADPTDQTRRLRCMLIAADVALNSAPPNLETAGKYLQQAARIIAQLDSSASMAAEFHYRMLQLAIRKGNDPDAQQHANWISENASGSPYELPALVRLAQGVAQNDAPAEEGYNVYRRLMEVLGNDEETLKTEKNARIAAFNFARYAAALGKFAESADAVERVLQTDPKNKRYLKLAAEASFQAGQNERAVEHYRTLVRGLPADTDEWYEAKYYQVAGLMKSEPDKGKQVLKQFQLMHRDIGDPWEAKFQQLLDQE